jgi:hypothetical protein
MIRRSKRERVAALKAPSRATSYGRGIGPIRPASCRVALAAFALLVASTEALPAPVRVFAIGHKQRLEDVESVTRFREKMFALVDAGRRGDGSLVQAGTDDVASHLQPRDPAAPELAVAHFPEDTGLIAGLIGSRGAAARATTSSTAAFATLLGTYADPIAYYEQKFPGLTPNPIRALVVALTDLLYRSVYETFRDIATTYGIYVSVSLNAAPARQILASSDPDLVARLRDPDEPGRAYAYEATSDLPHNVVLLFDPTGAILVPDGEGGLVRAPEETGGELRASAEKAYLIPIEQTLGLSLASGRVRDLDVLDTPVGAIGVVISKDAWMPDVNDRFDAKGANLTLQSEAFSEWAYAADPWQPDVFKESGFAHIQKHAGLTFNVAPSMTGNLFDVTFDGQTAIIGKRRSKADPGPRTSQNAWIGQLADRGFIAVAPWIVPDPPLPPVLDERLADRRRMLAASGVSLLPGSGAPCPGTLAAGACENGYRESIVWADLEIPAPGERASAAVPIDRRRQVTSFGANFAVSSSSKGRQRHPRTAADTRSVAVVWDDTRDSAFPQVYLAISRDGGRSFGAPVKVSDRPATTGSELFPAVAIAGDQVFVVWQSFDRKLDDDAQSIQIARFTRNGVKQGGDVRVDGGAALPAAGRWQPQVAILDDREPFVVWIDERDSGPDRVALEHVYAARGRDRGTRFSAAVRVDDGQPVPLAESLDNRWSPTVAVDGGNIHVAWTDFRDYNWDIRATRSTDDGQSFAPSVKVNDFADFERLCDAPRFAVDRRGTVRVAWTDLRAREPDTNIFYAESLDSGAGYGPNRQLDGSRRGFVAEREVPSDQNAVALATDGSATFAAWQDDRAGNEDIVFARLRTGVDENGVGTEERVDDTGRGPSNQYRPDLAIVGSGASKRCVVVWEDDREGDPRIYGASRACDRSGASPRPLLRRFADRD